MSDGPKPQKGSRIVTVDAWWGCEASTDAMDDGTFADQKTLFV